MKKFIILALTTLFISACSNSEQDSQRTLYKTAALDIYQWSDYVDPQLIRNFDNKNKLTTNLSYYDSTESLKTNVINGNADADLVVPSIDNVDYFIQSDKFQKIDKTLIPNHRHIEPALLKLMEQVDPNNEYTVPYFWGINTIGINKQMVAQTLGTDTLPENEWDLVFNPEYTNKLKSCGISFFDSPSEQYPLALKYLGKNPNSELPQDIEAANNLLKTVRPDVKRFSSSGYINDLVNGDLCVAMGFGGDLNIAKNRAKQSGNNNIVVLVPTTGVGIWIDSFMIPRNAKNVLNAHTYINYMLNPEIAAQNANFVTYAPSSKPARALMKKEYAEDASIFVPDDVQAKSFVILPKSEETVQLENKLWADLKASK